MYISIVNREQVNQNPRELMTSPGLLTSYRCFTYKLQLTGVLMKSNIEYKTTSTPGLKAPSIFHLS